MLSPRPRRVRFSPINETLEVNGRRCYPSPNTIESPPLFPIPDNLEGKSFLLTDELRFTKIVKNTAKKLQKGTSKEIVSSTIRRALLKAHQSDDLQKTKFLTLLHQQVNEKPIQDPNGLIERLKKGLSPRQIKNIAEKNARLMAESEKFSIESGEYSEEEIILLIKGRCGFPRLSSPLEEDSIPTSGDTSSKDSDSSSHASSENESEDGQFYSLPPLFSPFEEEASATPAAEETSEKEEATSAAEETSQKDSDSTSSGNSESKSEDRSCSKVGASLQPLSWKKRVVLSSESESELEFEDELASESEEDEKPPLPLYITVPKGEYIHPFSDDEEEPIPLPVSCALPPLDQSGDLPFRAAAGISFFSPPPLPASPPIGLILGESKSAFRRWVSPNS